MGRHVPVIRALLLGLLLSGCWHGPAPIQTARGVDSADHIITLDKAAWKLVALDSHRVERLEDGRLQIRLEVANLSSLDLEIQIQTIFRDAGGALTGEETPLEMIVLPGGGVKIYEVTSLQPGPSTFTVQIKTP